MGNLKLTCSECLLFEIRFTHSLSLPKSNSTLLINVIIKVVKKVLQQIMWTRIVKPIGKVSAYQAVTRVTSNRARGTFSLTKMRLSA